MPEPHKARCSHCGHLTEFKEGDEVVFCERCNFEMHIHYTLEKIEGNPISYLLKRASVVTEHKSPEMPDANMSKSKVPEAVLGVPSGGSQDNSCVEKDGGKK